MATDSPSHGGRRHFHRGRRGNDRRGGERRNPSQQQSQRQPSDQGSRGDQVDVEQIMREIRSNIAQRHGVELTDQQVQELAARRLESILDPRTIKPTLLDQLRRAAGTRPEPAPARTEPPYTFEDTTLFESPNGFVRFMRKLLAPILKLFFNPNPLIRALNIQARLNGESVKREAERDQRQAEWNALHYELLQRVVSETAKVSLEVQSLALRVESLAAKVDFNERRVRGIEGSVHQAKPAGPRERDRDRDRDRDRERDRDRDRDRDRERDMPMQEAPRQQQAQPATPTMAEPAAPVTESGAAEAPQSDTPRRRRRRRRGRRGGGAGEPAPHMGTDTSAAPVAVDADEGDEEGETDALGEAEATENAPRVEAVTTEGESVESKPVPVGADVVSLPQPDHELPAAVGQHEVDPDHLLAPAATPDDTKPDPGRSGQ